MPSGDIDFRRLLPRCGSTRQAFEELCFLLCSSEFRDLGKMIRREGAGGDGGLEGYLPNSTGAVEIAMQAKRFDGRIGASQWKQIDDSVRTALIDNAVDAVLEQYVVCTDCDFTKRQRATWERHVREWSVESQNLGYRASIKFEHWGAAKLREKLLLPAHHGLAVYFFDLPDLTPQRLWQVTEHTIANLGERYLPKLHARTTTESELFAFLRSASALDEFHQLVSKNLAPELKRPWRTIHDWSVEARPFAERAESSLSSLLAALGDGCSWPPSIPELKSNLRAFNDSLSDLSKVRRRECEQSQHTSVTPSRSSDSYSVVAEETGFVEGVYLGTSLDLADRQCMLVLGEAGTGKSHLLAHLASEYIAAKGAVVFLDGGRFTSSDFPWKQLLSLIDFDGEAREFLVAFSTIAAMTELPGLICIDALNESPDRDIWRQHLLTFALKLREYPNLKLLVSCRRDYAELTLPRSLIQLSLPGGWCQTHHHGLDLEINHAISQYFTAYEVTGTPAQCFLEEFRTPLFLKLVCEAFQGRAIPIGTLTLMTVFNEYTQYKAELIHQRIDIPAAQVQRALHALAEQFLMAERLSICDHQARDTLLRFHNTTQESKSLYRALVSEGILHESRALTIDRSGFQIEARFAYERLWDYFVCLHLWPKDAKPKPELADQINDVQWQRRSPGIVRILAMRFPEAGLGEIHDVVHAVPSRETRLLNSAFLDGLSWRHTKSCTLRTRELFDTILKVGREKLYDVIIRWALHSDHPWNAKYLHERLLNWPDGVGSRDRDWTLWVNEHLENESREGYPHHIIALAEHSSGSRLDPIQAQLLATTLSWMLSTTHVPKRRKIAFALATLLKGRLDIAHQLVLDFERVDDSYVFSGVLFACAAAAQVSDHSNPFLSALAQTVFRIVFRDNKRQPNLHSRFYAANLCETAAKKQSLPDGLTAKMFRPPFKTSWPKIQTAAEFKRWEKQVEAEYKAHSVWSDVLRSVRPHTDSIYGDWGRYEMQWATSFFQNRQLKQARSADRSGDAEFDARKAQRYVTQRVLQMGLDPQMPDDTATSHYDGRDRPRIERLGKKYQWIALSELLASLSDNFHQRDEAVSESVIPRNLRLVDQYDPAVLLVRTEAMPPSHILIKPAVPWWSPYPDPFSSRLSDSRRLDFCTNLEVELPEVLLRLNDGNSDWIPLNAHYEFVEPRPSFLGGGIHAGPRARLHWTIRSYIVSNAHRLKLENVLKSDEVGHEGYNPGGAPIESGLELLPDYPYSLRDADDYAILEGIRSTGASLTTCWYSSGSEDNDLKGAIPSAQLARLCELSWTGPRFRFRQTSSDQTVFESLAFEGSEAAVFRRDSLLKCLNNSEHSLVWRIYGWKWIEGGDLHDLTPSSREYVAVLRMKPDGSPRFIWGASWVPRPNKTIEPLHW